MVKALDWHPAPPPHTATITKTGDQCTSRGGSESGDQGSSTHLQTQRGFGETNKIYHSLQRSLSRAGEYWKLQEKGGQLAQVGWPSGTKLCFAKEGIKKNVLILCSDVSKL